MQGSLVSILLCTYNGEDYIKEQITSILNQSYENFELLIIDDCSTDHTFAICEKYEKEHSNISLFKNKINLGINKNFEKAISLAKGEYLAFADQDDVWRIDKIEILLKLIQSSAAILVYCNSEMINENGESTNTASTDHNVFVKGNNSKQLILYNTVSGHQMLFKKELVKHILPLPKKFWYDWWIAYIATAKFSIHFTEKKLVKYRIHQNSFVQSKKKNKTNRKTKIKVIISNLKSLYKSPITQNKSLLSQLIQGYESVLKYGISLRLLVCILANRKNLLYPRIKPSFNRFKRLRNYIKIGLAYKYLE